MLPIKTGSIPFENFQDLINLIAKTFHTQIRVSDIKNQGFNFPTPKLQSNKTFNNFSHQRRAYLD